MHTYLNSQNTFTPLAPSLQLATEAEKMSFKFNIINTININATINTIIIKHY